MKETNAARIKSAGWLPLEVNNLCRVFTAIQLKPHTHRHTHTDREAEGAQIQQQKQTKDAIELVKGWPRVHCMAGSGCSNFCRVPFGTQKMDDAE